MNPFNPPSAAGSSPAALLIIPVNLSLFLQKIETSNRFIPWVTLSPDFESDESFQARPHSRLAKRDLLSAAYEYFRPISVRLKKHPTRPLIVICLEKPDKLHKSEIRLPTLEINLFPICNT